MNKRHQRKHVSVSLNKPVVENNFEWKICAWKFSCLHKANEIMKLFSGGRNALAQFFVGHDDEVSVRQLQSQSTYNVEIQFTSENASYGLFYELVSSLWNWSRDDDVLVKRRKIKLLDNKTQQATLITCPRAGTSTENRMRRTRKKTVENEERMRKMFRRNKCKVNEPHAKLEHRLFYDFMLRRWIGGSRSLYDHFVRKLNLERKKKEFHEWKCRLGAGDDNCFENVFDARSSCVTNE